MASKGTELIGSTIASLVGGVSQQPPALRDPSQADEQVNILSRIEAGITRRPPTEWVAELLGIDPPTGGFKVYFYERDRFEKYIVLLADNALPRVFDFDGNEATVSEPDGHSYMNFDEALYDAGQAFGAITVADTTFIVNRTVDTAMSGVTPTPRLNEFLLVSKADGATNHGLTLRIDGVAETVSLTSPNIEGDDFIDSLYTAAAATFTNWTFTKVREGEGGGKTGVLYGVQTLNTGTPELVEANDTLGGRFHTLLYKKTQNFSDLPNVAQDGFVIEIVGAQGDEGESYWVEYDSDENAWVETVEPGLDNDFDLATMPHRLVRTSITPLEFTFDQVPWASRSKGDAVSAPEPSFIGFPIKDLVVHKNRLAVVASEDAVLTESGDFFNFWPTTVTTVVNSDPVDKTGSSNRVAFLDWAVPFDGRLLLVSGRGSLQSELVSEELALTPEKAVLVEKTAYDSSDDARPHVLGKSAFLVVDRVTASGILEYRSSPDLAGAAVVDELTSHIPTYLPAGITILEGSAAENTLIAFSPESPNALFVHRFYDLDGKKVMNSWSRWEIAEDMTILGYKIIRSVIWLVVHVEGAGIHLEKIDLRKLQDGDLGWRLCLDSQITLTGVFAAGVTTWTLPYDQIAFGGTYRIVKSDEGWDQNVGQLITIQSQSAGSIVAAGDLSDFPVIVGREFESYYDLSPIVLSPGAGRSSQATPITLGRLGLKQLTFIYDETGAFTISWSRRELAGEPTYTHVFPGREVGGPQLIGPVTLNTGEFKVSITGESRHVAVRISSSAITPFTITGIDWVGHFVTFASFV